MSDVIDQSKEEAPTHHKGTIIDELHQAGLAMKRCQLQRAYPDFSPEAIEDLLLQWLYSPPQGIEGWATLTVHDRKRQLTNASD